MIRVLVADDHPIVRAGLSAVINAEEDMCVVGQAASGDEALRLYRQHRPDVVTMDLKMSGMDGCAAIAFLRAEFPQAKVLVLTSLSTDEQIYRALQAGALGYLLKDTDDDQLAPAIRATNAGQTTIPKRVAEALSERMEFTPLTARELDVLRGVTKGQSNAEIGVALGLTENTVKGYLKSIASKLDAPDRTAAAMIALRRGLLGMEEL